MGALRGREREHKMYAFINLHKKNTHHIFTPFNWIYEWTDTHARTHALSIFVSVCGMDKMLIGRSIYLRLIRDYVYIAIVQTHSHSSKMYVFMYVVYKCSHSMIACASLLALCVCVCVFHFCEMITNAHWIHYSLYFI